MTKVAIVFHSGYGHTAKQAEAVRNGVSKANATPMLIPVEEADNHWDDLKDADAIIFGSPTYMAACRVSLKPLPTRAPRFGLSRAGRTKSPPASPTPPA